MRAMETQSQITHVRSGEFAGLANHLCVLAMLRDPACHGQIQATVSSLTSSVFTELPAPSRNRLA